MANFDNIQKQLLIQADIIFKKHKIQPENFFHQSFGSNSKKCHEEILQAISKVATETAEIKMLECSNYMHLSNIVSNATNVRPIPRLNKNPLNNREYELCKIFHNYYELFYDKFYRTPHNKVIYTNAENFELPSLANANDPEYTSKPRMTQLTDNTTYISKRLARKLENRNELEFLLMPNGNLYFAPSSHQTLAMWLTANGVNLKNAIRIECAKTPDKKSYFEFNSLYNHGYSTESNSDNLIEISKPQAVTIGELHRTLHLYWPKLTPITHSVDFSTGFGLGKRDRQLGQQNSDIANKNLNILYRNVDDLDLGALRINNDIFEPLDHTPESN